MHILNRSIQINIGLFDFCYLILEFILVKGHLGDNELGSSLKERFSVQPLVIASLIAEELFQDRKWNCVKDIRAISSRVSRTEGGGDIQSVSHESAIWSEIIHTSETANCLVCSLVIALQPDPGCIMDIILLVNEMEDGGLTIGVYDVVLTPCINVLQIGFDGCKKA